MKNYLKNQCKKGGVSPLVEVRGGVRTLPQRMCMRGFEDLYTGQTFALKNETRAIQDQKPDTSFTKNGQNLADSFFIKLSIHFNTTKSFINTGIFGKKYSLYLCLKTPSIRHGLWIAKKS